MLSTILKEINNYFYIHDSSGRVIANRGEFTIENGIIKPITVNIIEGQYIKTKGSILNDGIYKVEITGDGYIDIAIRDENYPQWVEPAGTVGLYHIDDRVTHKTIRYISLVNNNSWEPGTNDNLWEIVGEEEHTIHDETFTGIIAPLAIPRDFLELAKEISAFQEKALKTPNTGITSESFGNYSYSMATSQNGAPITWIDVFSTRLNKYRKMFPERI